jgi:hypothetical protein
VGFLLGYTKAQALKHFIRWLRDIWEFKNQKRMKKLQFVG